MPGDSSAVESQKTKLGVVSVQGPGSGYGPFRSFANEALSFEVVARAVGMQRERF